MIVISAADRMNLAAANALLKTLEEPLPGVIFILASEAPERVLPTVRSRCVRVALVAPAETMARHWIIASTGIDPMIAQRLLDAGGGAPILALGFADPERFEAYQAAQAAIPHSLLQICWKSHSASKRWSRRFGFLRCNDGSRTSPAWPMGLRHVPGVWTSGR